MIAFFKRLFGYAEADLGRILSSFRRTLADLEAHIAYHEAEVERHAEAAKASATARDEAELAASKAVVVHNNITRLLTAPV